MGIIFGGSGEGEAMCANRTRGARAVLYYGGTTDIIKYSREHNDANILAIGARFISPEETCDAVDLWLATEFSHDERHIRRLAKF
jgi:ribose 5-phosphate isomerase B